MILRGGEPTREVSQVSKFVKILVASIASAVVVVTVSVPAEVDQGQPQARRGGEEGCC